MALGLCFWHGRCGNIDRAFSWVGWLAVAIALTMM
jgi:hypothetical protein